MIDPMTLPPDLPEPKDDGAADHLAGLAVPEVSLPATDGTTVALGRSAAPRTVVYAYPWTGRPGEPALVADWDLIPGARGCTPETCGFRDHHAELAGLGAEVYGLSTQDTAYQREVVERLQLPGVVRIGRRVLIREDALLHWLSQKSTPSLEVNQRW